MCNSILWLLVSPFSLAQAMESGIASHRESMASLVAAGKKVVLSSPAESATEIEEDIEDLNRRSACDMSIN